MVAYAEPGSYGSNHFLQVRKEQDNATISCKKYLQIYEEPAKPDDCMALHKIS